VLEWEIFAFFFLKDGRSNSSFSSGGGPRLPLATGWVPPSLPVGGRTDMAIPGWVDLKEKDKPVDSCGIIKGKTQATEGEDFPIFRYIPGWNRNTTEPGETKTLI
jgi:hypothetical protein